jgi:hypothetical protein
VALVLLLIQMSCAQIRGPSDPSAAPDGAVMLFDGTDFTHWIGADGGPVMWKIEDGAMQVIPRSGSIMTRRKFTDFKLHVEFMIPERPPDVEGPGSGNSGVYLQRRYEVQILDSFGKELGKGDCGALYRARVPDRNVCKPPGEWQTYDIHFQAPRWRGNGLDLEKVENALITVRQNGVVIHNNVTLANKTGAGRPEGPAPGPILLQDHGNEVHFRNIWIATLDG